jgi:hypothetical protein
MEPASCNVYAFKAITHRRNDGWLIIGITAFWFEVWLNVFQTIEYIGVALLGFALHQGIEEVERL